DLRVPVPGGRVAVRALPGAQDDLSARLPLRLRLQDGTGPWTGRARPARVRRSDPGCRGAACEGAPSRAGGVLPGAGAAAALAGRCAAPGVADARGRGD